MALDHAEPGEVVNLHTYADQARDKTATALVKTGHFEAVLMNLPAGHSIPPHSVEGPIIVQCIEGVVDFPVEGASRVLRAGDWMHLDGGASHALRAEEASLLLVTILFSKPS